MTGSSHGKHDVSTNEVVDPEEQQLALSGDYNPPPGGDLSILMAATVSFLNKRKPQEFVVMLGNPKKINSKTFIIQKTV